MGWFHAIVHAAEHPIQTVEHIVSPPEHVAQQLLMQILPHTNLGQLVTQQGIYSRGPQGHPMQAGGVVLGPGGGAGMLERLGIDLYRNPHEIPGMLGKYVRLNDLLYRHPQLAGSIVHTAQQYRAGPNH